MLIGDMSAPEGPSDAETRAMRVQQARACDRWTEVDDLVPRGRYFVSAATDEIFRLFLGSVFNRAGGVEYDKHIHHWFTFREGDVLMLERVPGTWSERIARQSRSGAGAR